MTGHELMETLSAMSPSELQREVVVMVAQTAYDLIASCEVEEMVAETRELRPVIRLERAK